MKIPITTFAIAFSLHLFGQTLNNPILSGTDSSNKWILETPISTTSGNLYIAPLNQEGVKDSSKQITFFNNGSLGLGAVGSVNQETNNKLLIAGNINVLQGDNVNPKIGFYLNDYFSNNNNPSIAQYGITKSYNNTLSVSGWGGIDFYTNTTPQIRILGNGQILIGKDKLPDDTDFSNYKLYVQGGILASEVRVSSINKWPDYVFSKNYQLRSLEEIENYINVNGHLPNMPSALAVKEKGVDISEMIRIQQEKIEELTIYIIEQNKRIKALESKIK